MNLDEYIEGHIDKEPEELYELWRQTNIRLVNGRMCSGHQQGRLLKMLTRMIRPRRVLEMGTFSGYSALCIAEGLPEEGELTTVEVDDELEDFIDSQFRKSEYGSRIRLVIGDALEYARECEGKEEYDLIFIDADKRRYCEYYEAGLRILRGGGFMIVDNTLWSGHVIERSHDRDSQTRGIKAFNDMLAGDDRVEKTILPMRDGLTLIYKKP